jgi:hypothetical protein
MSNYPPPGSTGPTKPMNPQPTNPQSPYQQPPYQQQPYNQPPYQQGQPPYQQAPTPKKGKALMWTLIGCGGFLALSVIAVVAIGWFGYNKAKQAGFDPDLMQRNPALAAAKIAMMNNPDVEYVSIDESKNTITVKDKKTGKEITISAEKAKDGKIVVLEDGKEKVSIQGGTDGSAEIKTPEGTFKAGSNSGKLPDWLPQYPGVTIEGTYSVDSTESSGAGFTFTTDDSIEEVIDYYEDALKEEGFKITRSTTNTNGQTTGSIVGNDADYKRNVVISASIVEGSTKVTLVSQTKK